MGVSHSQVQREIDSLEFVLSTVVRPNEKVDILSRLIHLNKYSNFEKSLEYANEAIAITDELGLDEKRLKILLEVAKIYNERSDYIQLREYSMKAISLAEDLGNEKERAMALNLLSFNYYYLGDYEKSSELNFEALKIVEELGDHKGTLIMLHRIGAIYADLEELDNAYEYFLKALNIAKELNDDVGIAQGINNLGSIIFYRGEYEEFEKLMKEAVKINQRTGKVIWEGVNYLNLGELYLKQARYDSCFIYLKKAQSIFEKQNNASNLSSALSELSNYYKAIDQPDQALNHRLEAYHVGKSKNLKAQMAQAASQLSEMYAERNDFANAYMFSKIEYELKDSLNRKDNTIKLSQLESKYKIDNIEQEALMKQKQREFEYIMAGIFVLMCFLLLIALIIHRNRIQKKNLEIEKHRLSNEIELKSKELTTNVLYTIQKNKNLTSLSDELLALRDSNEKEEVRFALNKIRKKIEHNLDDTIWEDFEVRFQQVHNEFYYNLFNNYPDLTNNEKRLCAFLRLGMSSKEISSITGQSIPALEMARVRLRKKLGIKNREVNLINFLNNI